MMNKYYSYSNIELWREEAWHDRYSGIDPLAQWISKNGIIRPYDGAYQPITSVEQDQKIYFKKKTGSLELPAFLENLENQGFFFESHEMGFNTWLTMVPKKLLKDKGKKYPLLLVEHRETEMDPNWAMRTIDSRRAWQELALQENMIIAYNVRNTPDENAGYAAILSEALLLYPIDPERILLEVSDVGACGIELGEILNFSYEVDGKKAEYPEKYVIHFKNSEICALNISHRFERKISARWEMLVKSVFNVGKYDLERLKYSEAGRKIAEGMALEHRFADARDPGWKLYFEKLGLIYEEHFCKGERWLSLIPQGALESQTEKLPVIALMAEVNGFSDRLPVSTLSTYLEYCKMAAQGEFALLVFALESPEDNELWCDILKDAMKRFPLDASRVYMMGQSHNGHFVRDFAIRHANMLAGIATLSNGFGLPRPENSFEAVPFTDERMEAMSRTDIPLINLQGSREGLHETTEQKAEAWSRRLKASGCMPKTVEEILKATECGTYVEQKMKLTCDRSWRCYVDGIECLVSYNKNRAGKEHLCCVLLENTPHYPAPTMAYFVWSYLKQFARNLETGEVIETIDHWNP